MAHTDFDTAAATWDVDPAKLERSRVTADGIAAAVPLSEDGDAIEYGCGTGQVTWALANRLGRVLLLDASPGMIRVVEERIGTLPVEQRPRFEARVFNVLDEQLAAASVDVIYMSMALHHVADIPLALRRFADALRPVGYLAIADLDLDPLGNFHGHDFDGHHGFDRGRLAADLVAAGFTEPRFTTLTTLTKHLNDQDLDFPVFLAVSQPA